MSYLNWLVELIDDGVEEGGLIALVAGIELVHVSSHTAPDAGIDGVRLRGHGHSRTLVSLC